MEMCHFVRRLQCGDKIKPACCSEKELVFENVHRSKNKIKNAVNGNVRKLAA